MICFMSSMVIIYLLLNPMTIKSRCFDCGGLFYCDDVYAHGKGNESVSCTCVTQKGRQMIIQFSQTKSFAINPLLSEYLFVQS